MKKGFTLVELMIVMVVIAILIAILFPTFLAFRRDALVARAQGDLRSLLVSVEGFFKRNLEAGPEGYPGTPAGWMSVLTPEAAATGLGQLTFDSYCLGPAFLRTIPRDPFNSAGATYNYGVITAAGALSAGPVASPQNGIGVIIASPGPDGRFGTAGAAPGDISNASSGYVYGTAEVTIPLVGGVRCDDIVTSTLRVRYLP